MADVATAEEAACLTIRMAFYCLQFENVLKIRHERIVVRTTDKGDFTFLTADRKDISKYCEQCSEREVYLGEDF